MLEVKNAVPPQINLGTSAQRFVYSYLKLLKEEGRQKNVRIKVDGKEHTVIGIKDVNDDCVKVDVVGGSFFLMHYTNVKIMFSNRIKEKIKRRL